MPGMQYVENTVPPYAHETYSDIFSKAKDLEGKPYQYYRNAEGQPIPRLAEIPEDLKLAHLMGREIHTMRPYIEQSRAYSEMGAQQFPGFVNTYMNPYQHHVVNAIQNLGNRNFRENVLPALEAQFVGAGAYGGGRHRDLVRQATRDLNESIGREQGRALAAGYSQAGTLFGQDQARRMEAANQALDRGRVGQAQKLSDIAALEAQGRYQQEHKQNNLNMQYENFLREQQHPWDMLGRRSNIVQGIPMQTNQAIYTQNPAPAQPNTVAALGGLASQLLGATMLGGRKSGGPVKISNRLLRQIGI